MSQKMKRNDLLTFLEKQNNRNLKSVHSSIFLIRNHWGLLNCSPLTVRVELSTWRFPRGGCFLDGKLQWFLTRLEKMHLSEFDVSQCHLLQNPHS